MKQIDNDINIFHTSNFYTLSLNKDGASFQVFKQADFVDDANDQQWYVGMIIETDEKHGDFLINFMQPHGTSNTFNWPNLQDNYWVPKKHVLCVVSIFQSNHEHYFIEVEIILYIASVQCINLNFILFTIFSACKLD